MTNSLYLVRKDQKSDDYQVIFNKVGGRVVFYGTRAECLSWIERNGHDEWN
jgi:hypothetical protein